MIFRWAAPFFLAALGGFAASGNAADDSAPAVSQVDSRCLTVSNEELEKIPVARDPWVLLQATPGVQIDRLNIGFDESGLAVDSIFDGFEALRATLLEAEAKALCKEVQQDGWENLTLESALRAAPSQEETLINADTAGLLRGFVALLLHGKGCAETPAEVLYQAREYGRRFDSASSDRLPHDE